MTPENPIAIDFETFYSKKLHYSLKLMIPEQYCRHELFDPYMVSVCDGAQSWSGSPKDFDWSTLHGRTLLAHNARFDSVVFAEMQHSGMIPTEVKPKQWFCTADLSAYLCNRRSLDQAVEYLFKTRISKQARANAEGKRWNDFTAEEQKEMLEYAKGDAQWCWRIWDEHSGKWPDFERRLSTLTTEQGKRGVALNQPLLGDYIVQLHECRANIEKTIPWIAGCYDPEYEDIPEKPTSTKAIAYECKKAGIPCPPVKKDDPDAFELWSATYAPTNPWITQLSAWRSVNKQLSRFTTMKERIREDGTMPFSLMYFGGHTGRWAGGSRVNVQNELKDAILINELGLYETNSKRLIEAYRLNRKSLEETGNPSVWPSWVRHAINPRWVYVPRSGKKMIISDLSQIEPRILAWLVGDSDFLRLVASGQSPYEAFARSKRGWTGGKLKKEDPEQYALCKASILGLGYQCAWEKFITMAWTLAEVDLTENDPEWVEEEDPYTGEMRRVSGYGTYSKKVVQEFRESNPLVCHPEHGLWARLDSALRQSVGSDFFIVLPTGRRLRYEQVRSSAKIVQDPKTKKPLKKREVVANVGGRWKPFYGGKLTENLVQAVARDVFGGHLLNMESLGWHNLFGVHDEAVQEVDMDVTAKDVEHEMSKCPDFLAGCPISAEAHEVAHYRK